MRQAALATCRETRVSGVTVALDWAANCAWDSFPRFDGVRPLGLLGSRLLLSFAFTITLVGGTFQPFTFTALAACSVFALGIGVSTAPISMGAGPGYGADDADAEGCACAVPPDILRQRKCCGSHRGRNCKLQI